MTRGGTWRTTICSEKRVTSDEPDRCRSLVPRLAGVLGMTVTLDIVAMGGGGLSRFDGGRQNTGGTIWNLRGGYECGRASEAAFVAGFLNRPFGFAQDRPPAGECCTCLIGSAATSAAPESRPPAGPGTTFKARLEAGALQDVADYLGTIFTLSLPE